MYGPWVLTHTLDELQQYYLQVIDKSGPEAGVITIRELSEDRLVGTTLFDDSHLRPGAVISGPSLFTVVDSMGFLVTVAHSPKGSNGFTSALTMQFLRPAAVGELRAEARLLIYGKKSCVTDVTIFGAYQAHPVAQAVVTYVPVLPK